MNKTAAHDPRTAVRPPVAAALDTLVRRGDELAGHKLLPWTEEDAEMAAALRFLIRAGARSADAGVGFPLGIAGIVGGASSGKSTVFDNLLGGRHASHVTMMSHTTKGPILAVHTEHEEILNGWMNGERLLMPRLNRRRARPDDRTEGETDCLTVIPACADVLSTVLLVDTPDFTSQASLLEGDRTRNMLCWFDRVVVVVDEDRWFDRQTFGWMRDRLDRYDLPRLVVFNRNERAGPLTPTDLERLAHQASRLRADHVIVDHVAGRGLRTLPAEALASIRDWLAGADHPEDRARRSARLAHLLADRANHCLNANEQRLVELQQLDRALEDTVRAEMKSETRIAYDVLLSPSQAKLLNPYWQGIVRPGTWLLEKSSSMLRHMPGAALFVSRRPQQETPSSPRSEDMITRGAAFFGAEVSRTVDHVLLCAVQNPLLKSTGMDANHLNEIRPHRDDLDRQGRHEASRCKESFDRFVEVLERSAAELNVKWAASGGLLAGGLIGALLTAPAGGLGIPAGAFIGAAIGGPATGLSARSLMRLYKTLMGTPELRALWDAVKSYRRAILARLENTKAEIIRTARAKTLDPDDPLYKALTVLRDNGAGGPPQ